MKIKRVRLQLSTWINWYLQLTFDIDNKENAPWPAMDPVVAVTVFFAEEASKDIDSFVIPEPLLYTVNTALKWEKKTKILKA